MVVILIKLVLSAAAASACSVCGNFGNDPSSSAFLTGTLLLSVVPIIMIVGGAYYLYRQSQKSVADSSPSAAGANPSSDHGSAKDHGDGCALSSSSVASSQAAGTLP
jgi:hypothetical protein